MIVLLGSARSDPIVSLIGKKPWPPEASERDVRLQRLIKECCRRSTELRVTRAPKTASAWL